MTLRFEVFPTDLDATADFYTRVLGFSLLSDQRGAKNPYLALERDEVHIGAAARPDHGHRDQRRPLTGAELVLEVDDLDTEHRHVLASGWPLAADLQQRPWGQRDFRLLDPSGLLPTGHQSNGPSVASVIVPVEPAIPLRREQRLARGHPPVRR